MKNILITSKSAIHGSCVQIPVMQLHMAITTNAVGQSPWPGAQRWSFPTTVEDELISALPPSTHSAVEMLHDSALYKFMIDIDTVVRTRHFCCVTTFGFSLWINTISHILLHSALQFMHTNSHVQQSVICFHCNASNNNDTLQHSSQLLLLIISVTSFIWSIWQTWAFSTRSKWLYIFLLFCNREWPNLHQHTYHYVVQCTCLNAWPMYTVYD